MLSITTGNSTAQRLKEQIKKESCRKMKQMAPLFISKVNTTLGSSLENAHFPNL